MSTWKYPQKQIKEAVDNLPSGVCFFAENGLPVLCNRTMYRVVYSMCGKDPQTLNELLFLLDQLPEDSTAQKDGDTYILEDGTAWRFHLETIFDEDHEEYTQVIASEVTQIYRGSMELADNIERLKETQAHIKAMKEDLAAITRENEILSMKMRIHDELGSSLLRMRRYYLGTDSDGKTALLANWRNMVSMLKYRSGKDDEGDPLKDLLRSSASIGVTIEQNGKMPEDTTAARFIVRAIRQCVTNAVKHADGNRIFVQLTEKNGMIKARITNDGRVPEEEIVEGSGLSSLRERAEKLGGWMKVESRPEFALTVCIPSIQDDILIGGNTNGERIDRGE